jgi:hypothetical protein
VVAEAAGSAAWASRTLAEPAFAEVPVAIAARLFSIAEPVWENTISPIEAVIFQ